MFNFFKRFTAQPKPAARPKAKTAPGQTPASRRAAAARRFPDVPALPQVVEGNDHSDWALWEDSVNVLDSQMQGLTPSARIYERDKQTPSEYQDLDPFSRVNKKSR